MAVVTAADGLPDVFAGFGQIRQTFVSYKPDEVGGIVQSIDKRGIILVDKTQDQPFGFKSEIQCKKNLQK
jgi:hypothetical protein